MCWWPWEEKKAEQNRKLDRMRTWIQEPSDLRREDLLQTMIIAITILNVLPEKQKEVLQTLLSLIELPGKEKGRLSYDIFSDIEDKNVFNLISSWETRLDLDQHRVSADQTVSSRRAPQ